MGADFYRRHHKEIKSTVTTMQKAKRFAAVEAKTLATNFSALNALKKEYDIDTGHVWNLNEIGVLLDEIPKVMNNKSVYNAAVRKVTAMHRRFCMTCESPSCHVLLYPV